MRGSPSWPRQTAATLSNLPAKGYRIISGRVWWFNIFPHWKNYCAAQAVAQHITYPFTPPLLNGPDGGVYFTDEHSLQGMRDEMDFARRVGLSARAAHSCYLFGCVVVEFDTEAYKQDISIPQKHLLSSDRGLTVGGAREWIVQSNSFVYLDLHMRVMCYHSHSRGHVKFRLHL